MYIINILYIYTTYVFLVFIVQYYIYIHSLQISRETSIPQPTIPPTRLHPAPAPTRSAARRKPHVDQGLQGCSSSSVKFSVPMGPPGRFQVDFKKMGPENPYLPRTIGSIAPRFSTGQWFGQDQRFQIDSNVFQRPTCNMMYRNSVQPS